MITRFILFTPLGVNSRPLTLCCRTPGISLRDVLAVKRDIVKELIVLR